MPGWFGPLIAALLSLSPAVREGPFPPLPTSTAPATARCPQWYGVVLSSGFTEQEWPTVDRLMWCESRCEPDAYHPRYGASGLMQVLARYFGPDQDPFDPATNLAKAHEVYQSQGWRAWSCF